MSIRKGEAFYLFRQSFIVFTISLQSISNGVMLAFPSVLNPSILDPHSEIKATPSQASWLASILGAAGIVGFAILSLVLQVYGRKNVHILKNFLMALGWLTFYLANSLTTLFIARIIHGLAMGGIFVNIIIISEYVHPSRRGYFITIQKFAISTGTLVCHVLAVWYNWRQIAVYTLGIPILSLFMTFYWAESPFYLAMKGQYDECERSFHWLNGTLARNKELEDLIADQRKCREEKMIENSGGSIKKFVKQIKRRDFLKSLIISAILIIAIDFSGRNYLKAYIVQIMIKLIGNKSTAIYISIASDISVLSALILSCFAVRFFRRRLLIFSFGFATTITLFIVSLILFLKTLGVISISPFLAPFLILLINFIVHIGFSPVGFVVLGEIFPLELKGLGCCLTGFVFTSSYATTLKLTPVLMDSIGLEGTYFVYGLGLIACLLSLYFVLPETKDKPLLEIEKNLKGQKKIVVTETLLQNVS